MKNDCYTVGQLASRCGVAVKTVQYYADEGLLTARGGATDAGYRLFTDDDLADLRTIRSLRSLGFSLDVISRLMQGTADAHEMARMQLDVIDAQVKSLRRQRTIVEGALARENDADVRERLALAAAAASLGAAERKAAVEGFLDRSRRGMPLEGNSHLRSMLALDDLPDELTDEQLQSWIPLSALLDDEDFLAMIHKQHEPFDGTSTRSTAAFSDSIHQIIAQAVAALKDGCDAHGERVQSLVERWTQAFSEALGRPNDLDFRRWFLKYSEETNDPRIERFWELVGALKGRSGGMSPFTAAQKLLLSGLRANMQNDAHRTE